MNIIIRIIFTIFSLLAKIVNMTHILKELSANGVEFTRADVAALSPYLTRHVKRFGDYAILKKHLLPMFISTA